MGQALYRKYRSKNLSEIVGQEHITTTLDNALKQGRISHAYLFTGPRGTGKTSIARILANEVNGLPYDETATHLDIIEIDAASNRRIDEIRDLRERVHTAPSSAKYKVYIIDEVHMLTKEAFNALLKTLEEPPAHVIFILATTEAHKLPETIVSRTQRFTFKPVDLEQVVRHLAFIAKQEKIEISKEALELIAAHGGGSFRDSISLLDQASNSGAKVELADVQRMLGIAPHEVIDHLIKVIRFGGIEDIVSQLGLYREQGYQATQLAKQLAAQLREDLVLGIESLPPKEISFLLRELLGVPAAHDPTAAFELLLIDVVIKRAPPSVNTRPAAQSKTEAPKAAPAPTPEPEPGPAAPPPAQPDPEPEPEAEPIEEEPTPQLPADTISATAALDAQTWSKVLDEIKKTHNTLYGVARMAVPQVDGNTLTLGFSFAFHQKRINEAKNKQVISDVITKLTGEPVTIICIIAKDKPGTPPSPAVTESVATPTPEPTAPANNGAIDAISNIFGGAEILE